MSEPITKLQRWLDLIAYLVGRRLPVTVDELLEKIPAYAEKAGTGDDRDRKALRRMFERDKDELRRFGIPIRTVTYTINYGAEEVTGYRIDGKDFYLPYLDLVRKSGTGVDPEPESAGRGEARAESGDASAATQRAEAPDPPHRRDPRRRTRPRPQAATTVSDADAHLALEALQRVAAIPGFPLRREARSAFRKLAFDLDPAAFTSAPVLFVERPGAAELSDRLRRLSDALLARKRVSFRYHGIYRGEPTDRDVAPYGLLFQHGHWYLIGHCADREDVRVFRVGRMEAVEPNRRRPGSPDYEIPADFRLADFAGRRAWELGDDAEPPLRARVRFRFPAALWAERNGYGALETREPDGAQVRVFDVHQVSPFLRWILSQEGDAVILDPPELGHQLRALAAETAALYGREVSG